MGPENPDRLLGLDLPGIELFVADLDVGNINVCVSFIKNFKKGEWRGRGHATVDCPDAKN